MKLMDFVGNLEVCSSHIRQVAPQHLLENTHSDLMIFKAIHEKKIDSCLVFVCRKAGLGFLEASGEVHKFLVHRVLWRPVSF